MSITGKLLYNKLRGLRPDLSSGITPELLSKVCDDPSTQPFLEWFCKNVSSANILSNEEIKLKNTLEDASEMLEGEALDAALEEATKNCPNLLKLVDVDDTYREDLFVEYETLKESYKVDEEYLQSLRHSIKTLKEVENKLDDNIEEAEILLNKEQIETEKAYDDCSVILKKFDKDNCQFSKDVESLLNVYASAAKNQGSAVLWSQMPIDLFIKQIELNNHYLGIHIKKQFGTSANKEVQEEDSDYGSLINDSRDKQTDERMLELNICKRNLSNAKLQEINASVQEECYMAMLQCVQDIYNGGIVKVPENSKLHDEIQTLTIKRDILEQNIELLRDQQLPELVVQYAEIETIKILKNDALTRLERRKTRLEKLKNLYSLTGKHGHVYVDLLYLLMEMQFCRLREVTEFIADARHYILTEYKLSSARCEVMQQEQDKYATMIMQSPKTYNAFNKIFISMILGDDISNESSFSTALKRYDDLIADNAKKKELILETYLNDKLDKLRKLENEINKDYTAETRNGPTISFRATSYEISSKCEEMSTVVQQVQGDITKIRNQFKERMRMDANLEREKDILWQRFLAEPDILRMRYEEAKQKVNESHFRDTVESKLN
ncbi:PREDICTED: HAUS augmin-like complex subunit 3 [Cyphomyrmex costatus]|uniref:HAUS augmin-like complex subunit 3 n=1 Tax=Cyphomyrmex costatus TaxID=456900 RepID=A0A151I9G9_9HYME|nr:PREDICTED: HAUS augmin-like complex subunit 3 [Cyphomyrmex costatus]KYM95719.1 HAUS augmin-like complex subunit 3 [Cyphomyrmex costatus]